MSFKRENPSDHDPITCDLKINDIPLKIVSLNIPANRLAINRMLNRINEDGEYKGCIAGDETEEHVPINAQYFTFVTDFFSDDKVILFLQEVDSKFVDRLRLNGFTCTYSEEDASNRGGVAIVTKNAHVIFDELQPIFDSWTHGTETRSKHVGLWTLMKFGERCISVANLHLDASSAMYSIPLVESLTRSTNFVIGDFNLDIAQYDFARSLRCDHQYIPDLSRKRHGKKPIDHILYSSLENDTGITDLRMLTSDNPTRWRRAYTGESQRRRSSDNPTRWRHDCTGESQRRRSSEYVSNHDASSRPRNGIGDEMSTGTKVSRPHSVEEETWSRGKTV
jgi:hypothetical protein